MICVKPMPSESKAPFSPYLTKIFLLIFFIFFGSFISTSINVGLGVSSLSLDTKNILNVVSLILIGIGFTLCETKGEFFNLIVL